MNILKTGLTLSILFFLSACISDAGKKPITSANETWHLSASGEPQRLIITANNKSEVYRETSVEDGKAVPAHITCLFEAPSRLSFFAVLADAQEIWEMSYDPDADPVFPGFVHNYRTGQVEGIIVEKQPFARRRLYLDLDHNTLIFSPSHTEVIGYAKDGSVTVYNLDSRKPAGKLTNQINVSLLDSQFAIVDDVLVFILNFLDGSQQMFSTHSWHEVGAKTVADSTLVTTDICTN